MDYCPKIIEIIIIIISITIFDLRQPYKKHWGGQKNFRCKYIDLEKACDRVPRAEVSNCQRLKAMDTKYIPLIQDMSEGSKKNVKCTLGAT